MNLMKNILRLAMVAFAAIALSACEKGSESGDGEKDAVVFAADVDNITATSAKIKVSHNGKTADSWYGLLTTDVTTRESQLIEECVATLQEGDLDSQLIFNKNYTKILTPLSPNTTYKYIAFGLTEDGVVYGEHAVVEFTTLSGNGDGEGDGDGEDEVYDNMLPNPAWSIAYTGVGTVNGTEYKHTVTVNSTDNNPYIISVVYAREYDPSNPSQLREFGEQLIDSLTAYLESHNAAYGASLTLNDMLFRGNGIDAFDHLDPGYYIALAMGITSKGEVSGLYAVSQTFHIEEEAPTALYSSWLGDWVFKGDNNISNNVVIGRKVANKSINLMGLQGLPFAVAGEYSTARNDVIFYAQVVAQNYEFNDGSVGDIHLVGLNDAGKHYGLDNGNYGIAIAGVLENGKRAIVRYGLNDPGYPKLVAMMLVAYQGGQYYTLSDEIPSFNGIAELAPAETTASTKLMLGTSRTSALQQPLRLGKKIETAHFDFNR